MFRATETTAKRVCYKRPEVAPIQNPTPYSIRCKSACSGYNAGNELRLSCNFVSVPEMRITEGRGFTPQEISDSVDKGVCVYQLKTNKGMPNLHVLGTGRNCDSCDSCSEGAKKCDYHVPVLDYARGVCGFHIRSKKLANRLKEGQKLNPDEEYCLGCSGVLVEAKCAGRTGYRDIRNIVDELCESKSRVLDKLRIGLPLEGLELICAGCECKDGNRQCQNANPFNAFEVWAHQIHSLPQSSISA